MKAIFVILILTVLALQSNAQLVRSSTLLEASTFSIGNDHIRYLDQINFDQTLYWRKKFNGDSQLKTVYNLNSLFKRDSVIGIRLYGIDIDMMTDMFEKKGANKFRYWNKLRLGFTFILNKNPKHPDYPLEEAYNYLDAEAYILYHHLPKHARGDRYTRSRGGSVMIFFLVTPAQRINSYIKVKPIGSTWVKAYYMQEYAVPRVGLGVEIETNKRGYDKTKVESSKDLYRGLTLIAGSEFSLKTSEISFRFGMKIDLRNH